MPGRRIGWILLGLAGLIEIQTELHAANRTVPNQIGRVTASDICVKHLMTRTTIEKNNSLKCMNSDRWRREWRGSERDRDRVGGTEGVPKSLTQKKVLANFFVPGLSILVVVEILEGGWEERAAVGSMPCNDSTVLRVAFKLRRID